MNKTIDMRKQTDLDGSSYYIVFCARAGSPTGHAFVIWYSEDNNLKMCITKAYGFYPLKQGKVLFGDVPGDIRKETLNGDFSQITDRLTIRVNRTVYMHSQYATITWKTTEYNLFHCNCINFTMDVANQIGLTVPKKGIITFPSDYIQKLINAN